MNTYLVIAAVLLAGISLNHSILGEKYIVMPLLRMDGIPGLFGKLGRFSEMDPHFMRRVLRMSWHLTVLPWFALSLLFFIFAHRPLDATDLLTLQIAFALFLATTGVVIFTTRGRHFSWLVFLAITGALWLGMEAGAKAPL
ncbi:MAG TPA: hypothetical protein VK550_28390 [Polyangiaceae bacterium]|nr:hypothetical protein [Polyangiaceae bacterium]